ncbi:MAG TPA: HNH endonuclease [Candidatus Eisenbacteria bacterium]|nr:HNH endonuclease [Candidatus Eisenbacteria bacterium]
MKPQPFLVEVSAEHVRREREKARALRATPWWKRKRAAGVCYHCGGRFPARELTMDHLVPIIRGGKSTKGNVVPSCKQCNTERKYRLPFEDPG